MLRLHPSPAGGSTARAVCPACGAAAPALPRPRASGRHARRRRGGPAAGRQCPRPPAGVAVLPAVIAGEARCPPAASLRNPLTTDGKTEATERRKDLEGGCSELTGCACVHTLHVVISQKPPKTKRKSQVIFCCYYCSGFISVLSLNDKITKKVDSSRWRHRWGCTGMEPAGRRLSQPLA